MQIRGFIFSVIGSFQVDSIPLKYIQQAPFFFFHPSQQLNHTSTSNVCNVICYVGISLPSLERLSHKILAIRMRIFLMAGKPILCETEAVSSRGQSWHIAALQQLSGKNKETDTESFSHAGSPGNWQRKGIFWPKWLSVSRVWSLRALAVMARSPEVSHLTKTFMLMPRAKV